MILVTTNYYAGVLLITRTNIMENDSLRPQPSGGDGGDQIVSTLKVVDTYLIVSTLKVVVIFKTKRSSHVFLQPDFSDV